MKQTISLSVCIILFLIIGIMTSCKATNNEMSTTHNAIVENQPADDAPINELILGDWYLKDGNSYQPNYSFYEDGTFMTSESERNSFGGYEGSYTIDNDIKNLDLIRQKIKYFRWDENGNLYSNGEEETSSVRTYTLHVPMSPWERTEYLWAVDSTSLWIKDSDYEDAEILEYSRTAPQKGDLYNRLIDTSWEYVSGAGNNEWGKIKRLDFFKTDMGEWLRLVFSDRSETYSFRINEEIKTIKFAYWEDPHTWGLNSDQWELIDENTMYFCGCKMTRVK